MKAYAAILKGHDECPVCNGTGRAAIPERDRPYKSVLYGYDAATDTMHCQNCGGQYMFGQPAGQTRVDPATGQGCHHTYASRKAGRSLTEYTCTKCGDSYTVDSGD